MTRSSDFLAPPTEYFHHHNAPHSQNLHGENESRECEGSTSVSFETGTSHTSDRREQHSHTTTLGLTDSPITQEPLQNEDNVVIDVVVSPGSREISLVRRQGEKQHSKSYQQLAHMIEKYKLMLKQPSSGSLMEPQDLLTEEGVNKTNAFLQRRRTLLCLTWSCTCTFTCAIFAVCSLLAMAVFFWVITLLLSEATWSMAFFLNPDIAGCDNDLTPFFQWTPAWENQNETQNNFLSTLIIPEANKTQLSHVEFKAADGFGMLRGVVLKSLKPDAKTVITVHGIRSCLTRDAPRVTALMLWKHGYNVLSFNVRNHRWSDRDTGYATFGSLELFDVEGAVQYALNHNISRTREEIGTYGMSHGGATVASHFGLFEGTRATFMDSPACDVVSVLKHNGAFDYALWAHCTFRWSKELHDCAPFKRGPLHLLKSVSQTRQRRLHFEISDNDETVPAYSVHNCIKAVEGKVPTSYHSTPTLHGRSMVHDIFAYRERLLTFFDEALG